MHNNIQTILKSDLKTCVFMDFDTDEFFFSWGPWCCFTLGYDTQHGWFVTFCIIVFLLNLLLPSLWRASSESTMTLQENLFCGSLPIGATTLCQASVEKLFEPSKETAAPFASVEIQKLTTQSFAVWWGVQRRLGVWNTTLTHNRLKALTYEDCNRKKSVFHSYPFVRETFLEQ